MTLARIEDVTAGFQAAGAENKARKDEIADINERLDISPIMFSGATQTAMIQAAINYAAAQGGGDIALLGRTWDIVNIGTVSAPGRQVGLLLKPGVILKGGRLRRGGTDMKFDLVRGEGGGIYPDVADQMGIRDVSIDGCARNRIDGEGGTGFNNDGFNLYLLNIKNPVCEGIISKDPASWGIRIERCTGGAFINRITCDHGADVNADGVHFVDCSNITGHGFEIVTEGDDGFIVEAKNHDVENNTFTGITVRSIASGVVSARRPILILRDTEIGTTLRRIRNNTLEAVTSDSPYPALVLDTGACEVENNTFSVNSLRCQYGAQIQAGSPLAPGYVRNNTFIITASDTKSTGLMTNIVGASVLSGNKIEATITNPADGTVGASLRGSRWTGSIVVNYDPNGTKANKLHGVDLLVTDSTLMCESRGAKNNLYLRDGCARNTINLGSLQDATDFDVNVTGSAVDTVFLGGSLSGSVSAPSQLRFIGTLGANTVVFSSPLITDCTDLDLSTRATGTYRTGDSITTAGTWPGAKTGFQRTGILRVTRYDTGTMMQEWLSIGAEEIWFRRYTAGAFGAWRKVTAA